MMGNQSSANNDECSDASGQAQATMTKMAEHCPGISFAIATSRSVVHRGSIGKLAFTSCSQNNRVTANTMFMAYSVSQKR